MSKPILVTLPFPHGTLSPNNRSHWRIKTRERSIQRNQAMYECLESMRVVRHQPADGATAKVALTFCPPDKRRRDADNVLASLKGALDGISDALGIDDSKFAISFEWGPVRNGGQVLVRIEVVNP